MTLIYFKYALPILLGYTIFVAIAGKYAPFIRPKSALQRPIWFLGLWVGSSIGLIAMVGLHRAYSKELHEIPAMVAPAIYIIIASLLTGIVGYFWYRSRVKRQISVDTESQRSNGIEQKDPVQLDNTLASDAHNSSVMDKTKADNSAVSADNHEQQRVWAENKDNLVVYEMGLDETLCFDVNPENTDEPAIVDDANIRLPEHQSHTKSGNHISDGQAEAEVSGGDNALSTDQTDLESFLPGTNNALEAKANAGVDTQIRIPSDSETLAQMVTELETTKQKLDNAREELVAEIATRKELETHLRITRNGLGVLESESREFESNKAAALIEVERELEEKVKRASAAEARSDREVAKRVDLENEVVKLREDALQAAVDCRVSTEARANALSTANKATTLARQAIQIRTRLESQLEDAKAEINSKQVTISSLIKALEKEKARTKEEVASMAKQLRLHEKQLQARRTLEEVSRSVDNKLTSRLVKKVAKARG